MDVSVFELDDGVLAGADVDDVVVEQALVLLADHQHSCALLGSVAHASYLAIDNLGG